MVDPARPHLLYIDDDAGLCVLVRRFCARNGWPVTTATDWAEGLALARVQRFDAIALDHFMPGREGLDLIPDLLATDDPPPIIYVTAAEEPRIAVSALKAGAADYVVKDVQGNFLELMAAAVTQAIVGRRLLREKEAAERQARNTLARLETLTDQQALLLREMNHRIANSLQLITSLLEMHARKSGNETVRAALRQASERVEAVAKVHQRLYTSPDVTAVDMGVYLEGLLDELERVAEQEGGTRCIQLSAEPALVPTDKAISIGLIVSELVTNALKYAYPDGTGPVRVSFSRLASPGAPASWLLRVEDDGVGFTSDARPRGTGLGTVIIGAMARTLDASVRHETGGTGTSFAVSMPV